MQNTQKHAKSAFFKTFSKNYHTVYKLLKLFWWSDYNMLYNRDEH